ncbi:MAG: F0F1 ATP synthase subunit B [Rhodobacteraceae bacterium]|jgi:F-type H+-transporting ATPase subunit b|nr:F0F1 ATP synthase subunit B [Paracoccaceae bacterium]MBL4556319.1 F0F1 ATP synthase subunit B [Paracoccaceae bacterium]HBG99831.1 ATP F0F1 synthase subunit B [Paracoccaceae bacterium]
MRIVAILTALATAVPGAALAASGPFFSLGNSDFVVLIAFLGFVGVLVYFRVPSILLGMLDKRAETIGRELDEARALREEAQTILASYERKAREVHDQADRIVRTARAEAEAAAEEAKADLARSIDRRLKAADEQIASAEQAAIRQVRNRAVALAVEAAREVIAERITPEDAARMIESGIEAAGAQLH